MKKLLLCSTLIIALCLVGCNDNTNPSNSENSNQGNQNNSGVATYESPDFSNSAGFKVNLTGSLKNVTYDSVFLMNDSIAQLDLIFPNNMIGTLSIDPTEQSLLTNVDDVVFVDDIKVSIKHGADGIYSYEWQKDNYYFLFDTKTDIKDSQILKDLINEVNLEKTK